MDDLHAVACGQGMAGVQAARDDLVVHLHGNAALAVTGFVQQLGDGGGGEQSRGVPLSVICIGPL